MKFLIVSQYFWPETFIINDLAGHLVKLGHEVTVLTGKPNYPEGKVYAGYRASGIQHERSPGGFQIHRVPLRPRGNGGGINLALNYLSFIFSGLLRFPRLVSDRHYDTIIFFAPSPMTSAITAIPLKYLLRTHLAIWVQDLWPASLSATGHVSNNAVLFLIRQLVHLIYRAADTLMIQSQAFYRPVAALADEKKIVYFPNFSRAIDTSLGPTGPYLPETLRQILENKFCIVFSGNLGTAQSLDTIVDAAALLDDLPQLKILLVGSGSLSAWIERQVTERNLQNIQLPGRLPVELMPELYSLAKGLLVTLKDQEIFSLTVPSKFQGYLAAAKPILAAINGETARILEESGAGYASRAEDAAALADSIRKLYYATDEERAAMGERGLIYFKRHFEMESQTQKLIEILQQRISDRQA